MKCCKPFHLSTIKFSVNQRTRESRLESLIVPPPPLGVYINLLIYPIPFALMVINLQFGIVHTSTRKKKNKIIPRATCVYNLIIPIKIDVARGQAIIEGDPFEGYNNPIKINIGNFLLPIYYWP